MASPRHATLVAITTAVLLLSTASAYGHGGGEAKVRAVLGPLPEALAGMRIELHETIGPQLVLENPTPRVVEVLDDRGAPFLRIGPAGVEGNVAAPAWYQTYSPGAPVPSGATHDAAPRWLRAREEPSFGWFEPRLDAGDLEVPQHVVDAAKPGDVGSWGIPLRVDGKPVTLGGRFQLVPPAKGRYVARLTSPSELAPGVRVRLLPGRAPGLLVENASQRVLTVFGEHGEPFLRIGPEGVEANLQSSTWRRSGRAAAATAARQEPGNAVDWQRVASVPRFGWLDPRTAAAGSTVPPADGKQVRSFRVPLRLGDAGVTVTGEIAWRPIDLDAPVKH